jgi:aminoglycoside phosphotransferase (APT) family kinase protein
MRPLGRFDTGDDFAVVVRPDPLAGRTGDLVAPDRDAAWRWLRGFQAATTTGTAPLGADEAERGVADVREAWGLLGGDAAERGARAASRALAAAGDAPLPACAVHGDFWRGNVSHDAGALRVFDWEWGRLDGRPLLDLWTYELSDAEQESDRPREALAARLGEALRRVSAELSERGISPAFAAAGLPLAVAELLLRFRRATGSPGPAERSLLPLLEPIEDVLALQEG